MEGPEDRPGLKSASTPGMIFNDQKNVAEKAILPAAVSFGRSLFEAASAVSYNHLNVRRPHAVHRDIGFAAILDRSAGFDKPVRNEGPPSTAMDGLKISDAADLKQVHEFSDVEKLVPGWDVLGRISLFCNQLSTTDLALRWPGPKGMANV